MICLSMLKFSRHLLQQLTDGQMLGAYPFALSAADAVRGPAAVYGQDIVIVIIRIPAAEALLCIVVGEHVGNQDRLRAGAFLDAVAAGCAGDHIP